QFSLDEVMGAEMMAYPNTLLMCCPTGDGSAALVLVSEEKLQSLSDEQRKRAVKISASVMTSDPWTETDQVQPDVNTLTRDAANQAYESAGVDPSDLDLVELHDCFATAELIHYDNLGLCKPGEAGKFIDERGPRRGEPLGAALGAGLVLGVGLFPELAADDTARARVSHVVRCERVPLLSADAHRARSERGIERGAARTPGGRPAPRRCLRRCRA